MKIKIRAALICVALILLAGTVVFLFFHEAGQSLLYDMFGGRDLHLVSADKELYWFDVRHSNDPDSPMFGRIESAFLKFAPDLLLVEGGFHTFEGSREAAIREGESAFAALLAKQSGIPVEDIEPPLKNQLEYLQANHTPEEVLAMYLLRQISAYQWRNVDTEWDFDGYLLDETQSLKSSGLRYTGEALEEILRTVNAFLPEAIHGDNWRDVDIRAVAYVFTREGGLLYPVYNDVFTYRNIWLTELIAEKKIVYDRIFIVMGGQHLRDTRENLESIYGL